MVGQILEQDLGWTIRHQLSRFIAVVAGVSILSACSGGGSTDSMDAYSSNLSVSGSVGDGPLVNADIQVVDATGNLVIATTSDLTAGYQLVIPDRTPLPVTVTATGGTDLVTGRAAEFPLKAITFGSGPVTLNMTPYTTLAVELASCRNELNPKGLKKAWTTIDEQLNLGWRSDQVGDPMTAAIDMGNVATILLSSEALGEMFRRIHKAVAGAGLDIAPEDLVTYLACDLADGRLDGSGTATGHRLTVPAVAAKLSVQLEVLAGNLHVDDQPVADALDSAMRTIMPASEASVLEVAPSEALINQVSEGLRVFQGAYPDTELLMLEIALRDATETTARGLIQPNLDTAARINLDSLAARVALADDALHEAVWQRIVQVRDARAPVVSLSADNTTVSPGSVANLSWASSDADQCVALGDWTGVRNTEGLERTEPVSARSSYELVCVGLGGTREATVVVEIESDSANETDRAPTVTLTASSTQVPFGGNIELAWSTVDADSCSATGGWAGARGIEGTLLIGPLTINQTYGLDCRGPGGTTSESITINVEVQNLVEVPGTDPAPTPSEQESEAAPTVTLQASPATVDAGGASVLSWSSTGADSCTASGGWNGSRSNAGSEAMTNLTQTKTFSLNCTGPGGSAIAMVSIAVNGSLVLNWQAPTQNVDGSALTDLGGYRLYYGSASRDYSDSLEITDPAVVRKELILPRGTYYVAMTSLDLDGNESAYSNEVVKIAQ